MILLNIIKTLKLSVHVYLCTMYFLCIGVLRILTEILNWGKYLQNHSICCCVTRTKKL